MTTRNDLGQPVGDPVDWTPRAPVRPVTLAGRTCRLEPVAEHHVDALYAALCLDSPPETWTYLTAGPFDRREDLAAYLEQLRATPGTVPLAVVLPDGAPVGVACFLRCDPANGVVEVGSITMAAPVQRTTVPTEAMHLMAVHALDGLGYRRYEWKCDALNEPSRRAALRLGFTFEGVFRQAVVYKGRNRDTAWFSILDREWPAIRAAQQRWLEPGNFDEGGRQRSALQARGGSGPWRGAEA